MTKPNLARDSYPWLPSTKTSSSTRSPSDVWDALRDFGALHTRLVPGFVTDTRLDGDARIVTFSNGTVAREILVDCDDKRAAAGLRHHQRTHEAAQRLGAGV